MPRRVRDEEEIRATAEELPIEPPEEAIEIIKKRQNSTLLIYRAGWCKDILTGEKEKTALVKCTTCGKEYHLRHVAFSQGCGKGYGMKSDPFGFLDSADNEAKGSYDSCICACCGAGAKAIHIGKISNTTEVDTTYFMTFHNIRGHFVMLSWILFKESDKYGRISYKVRRYEGLATIGGEPIRFTGYVRNMSYYMCYSSGWDTRKRFDDNCDIWQEDDILFFDKESFEKTDSAKSALDVFIRDGKENLRIAAYMQLWTKYPQIENLVRNGLSNYVKRIISEATYGAGYYGRREIFYISDIKKYINTKKKKPTEMLELEKDELYIANKYPLDAISFYKFIKKERKIRLTEDQLRAAVNIGARDLKEILEKPIQNGILLPVVRTINYLQKVRYPKEKGKATVTVDYLKDYWNMVVQVQNELPPELIFPKDIRTAHDIAMLKVKEKTDRIINEGIETYAKQLEWLSFTDEETGLFIRACANQSELIKEGKYLRHCVGGYAKKVSEHKTSILFIRRIEEPDIPFYTLEYKEGLVIQNRGHQNCNRTEDVEIFEKKWLDYIKKYKEIKNAKRSNRNKERISAGA